MTERKLTLPRKASVKVRMPKGDTVALSSLADKPDCASGFYFMFKMMIKLVIIADGRDALSEIIDEAEHETAKVS